MVDSFSHTNRRNSFNVSWSGGAGYSDCILQQNSAGGYRNLGSIDCASGSGSFTVTTPGANWNGRDIRMAANNGATVLNTFGALTCTTTSAATSPTPTVDEDCNGVFDNTSSVNIWVSSGSAGSISNNGCSYGNYGTIGGSCSGCSSEAAFCIRNSNNTISRVCSGSGSGARSYSS
jgi:hypothetical protein